MSIPRPDRGETPFVLGLLGGTFDPVHLGHRQLADAALASGAVQRVRWIPAGHPPHRAGPVASPEDRLEMVRLMIENQPAFEIDRSEIDTARTGEPSYTVLTLERLRQQLGARQPVALIMGADAFLGLPTWHRWEAITGLAHLLVTTRPGSRLDPSHDCFPDALRPLWENQRTAMPVDLASRPAGLLYCFPMTECDVSATELRRRLTLSNAQFEGYLPPSVVSYIRQRHLYS